MDLKRMLLLALFGLILLIGVTYNENPKIQSSRLSFHVQESNALYFKNLRQFYYTEATDSASKMKVRRLKSLSGPLKFDIVDNWLQDEAYIFWNWEGESLMDTLLMLSSGGDTLRMYPADASQHIAWAHQVYGLLSASDDRAFSVFYSGKRQSIWRKEGEREAVLRGLKDYFKLTGAL